MAMENAHCLMFFLFLEEGGSLRIVLHFSEAIVNHPSPIVPELGGIWWYNPSNDFVVYGIALLTEVTGCYGGKDLRDIDFDDTNVLEMLDFIEKVSNKGDRLSNYCTLW